MAPVHASKVYRAIDGVARAILHVAGEESDEIRPVHLARAHRKFPMLYIAQTGNDAVNFKVVGRIAKAMRAFSPFMSLSRSSDESVAAQKPMFTQEPEVPGRAYCISFDLVCRLFFNRRRPEPTPGRTQSSRNPRASTSMSCATRVGAISIISRRSKSRSQSPPSLSLLRATRHAWTNSGER